MLKNIEKNSKWTMNSGQKPTNWEKKCYEIAGVRFFLKPFIWSSSSDYGGDL